MTWNKSSNIREPLLGGGKRKPVVHLYLNEVETEAMDRMVDKRRCRSRPDYVRWLLECDVRGEIMVVDDAFVSFCEALGRGFGGAAAELTAQADAYRLRQRVLEPDDIY